MSKEKSRIKAINIYVRDRNASTIFYQEIGFSIVKIGPDDTTGFTHMLLSGKQEVMLNICDANEEQNDGCISIEIDRECKISCHESCKIDIKKMSFIN